ncbi:MAG: hypothetical protein ACI9MC_001342 [Kiritimatiellia bacterium]|jgi:hypothetical protein
MAYSAIRLASIALITTGLTGCFHVFPDKSIEPVFKDRGGEFTGNPYNHLEAPEYSKGRIAGFRELFVEAEPFATKLEPTAPLTVPTAAPTPGLPADMVPVAVVMVDLSKLDEGHSWDDVVAAFADKRAAVHAVMPSAGMLLVKAPADQSAQRAQIKTLQNLRIAGRPLARYSLSFDTLDTLPEQAAAGVLLAAGDSALLTVVPKPPPAPNNAPSHGTISVDNISTSYAEVTINGAKVGVVPPLARARVHNVKSGMYDVDFLLPNGFKWTEHIETTAKL